MSPLDERRIGSLLERRSLIVQTGKTYKRTAERDPTFVGMRCLVTLAAIAVVISAPVLLSQTSVAADSARVYRYDLERYLFQSPAAEVAQRPTIDVRIKDLDRALVGQTGSAAGLLRVLQLMDSVAAQSQRHSTYLYLRRQTNTLDASSAEARSVIDARARGAATRVRAALMRVDATRFERFVAQEPRLAAYRFVFASANRSAPHTPDAREAAMLSRMIPSASDWPLALYDLAMSRIPFGSVSTPNGPLDVYRQRGAIANSPDTAVRSEGNRKLWAGYNSQRDLFAMALIGTVRARTAIANERHFESAPAEVYFRAFLTPADVRSLIGRVRARAELLKQYQRILAAHALWLGKQSTRAPTWRAPISLDSASRQIIAALAPLGPVYHHELTALLDPTSGRVDARGGEHRAGGGASFGGGASASGIYLSAFEGFPADVSRLAHEAGHAVENQLHFVSHISPAYANGTSNMVGADFLSEAYAQLNELALADTMLRRATTDGERQLYLLQFLSHALEPFYGAQDAELEQAIYDGVTAGRITTADHLDSVTAQVDEAYDTYGPSRPELRARWIPRRVMNEDPVYYFNYLYSGLLSIKLFERYTSDRGDFVPRYTALIRRGYQQAPKEAIRQALGIDLTDPTIVDDAVRLIQSRLTELDQLFARLEGRSLSTPP